MRALTTLIRLLVGLLFIVSGYVKINDPLGFGFKLEEYWEVFGFPWLSPYSTAMAWSVCLAEIALGIALLTGYKKKTTLWLLSLMIVFFTFLTFYSAWFNKVTDCGCFGDALKLTPWQSFSKDVVLCVLIGLLWLGEQHLNSWGKRPGKPVFWLSFLFGVYGLWCLYDLPVIDFTAYKKGNSIPDLMKVPEGATLDSFSTVLVYEKNGQEKEFSLDNYPAEDSTWKWKDTRNILIRKGYVPPIHDFSLDDLDGNAYTEDFLIADYTLLIVCRKLKETDLIPLQAVNALFPWSESKGIRVAVVSNATKEDVLAFKKQHQLQLPFYVMDGTTMKTMVRSNPGLLMLKKGVIVGKWSENRWPSQTEIESLMAK